MYYAVHIMEAEYQGLHGIEEHFIWEANSEEELFEDADTASIELMHSYGIIDEFREEVENDPDYWEGYEVEDAVDMLVRDNVYYRIYPLDKLPEDADISKCEIEFFEDEEEFLSKYWSAYKR